MEELSSTIGISRPTLSKYFQDTGSVRNSTKERIEQALDTVDYVPNFFATKMNRQFTRIIGVIVPYLNDLFFTSLIQSIEQAAHKRGYIIMIQCAHGDAVLESRAFETLKAMSADGIIAAPIGHTSSLNTISKVKEELPVVFVDSRFPDHFNDVDFVGTNNEQSISLMVEYLHQLGSSPVFLGMPRINSNSLERERAYTQSAKRLGFDPLVIPVDSDTTLWNFEEFAFEAMDAYFSNGEFVDATILCANDRLAIGVIRAANKHGLLSQRNTQLPRLRVAGHDDHPLSAYVFPALTTVSRNTEKMGSASVDLLLEQIENTRSSCLGITKIFDAELRLRESA